MAIAIAGYTLAGTLATLIALRLVTGVGEALVFVGTGTIVADLAPVDRRGEALSIYTIGFWSVHVSSGSTESAPFSFSSP